MSIVAPRCMPAVVRWVTRADPGVTEVTADLTPADTVDLVAVDDRGRHVPFVRLDVIPFDVGFQDERPSKAVMSDSLGKIGMTASTTTNDPMMNGRWSTSPRSIAETAAAIVGAIHSSATTPSAASSRTR